MRDASWIKQQHRPIKKKNSSQNENANKIYITKITKHILQWREKMQITKVKDKWRSKHKEKGSEKLTYQVILKDDSHHSHLLHVHDLSLICQMTNSKKMDAKGKIIPLEWEFNF